MDPIILLQLTSLQRTQALQTFDRIIKQNKENQKQKQNTVEDSTEEETKRTYERYEMIKENLADLQAEYNRRQVLGSLDCYCFFFNDGSLKGIHTIRATKELHLNTSDYQCRLYKELSDNQLKEVVNFLISNKGENNG